ncbi:MAG: hypothetical protein R3F59_12760 [Myxococcota bacterium]
MPLRYLALLSATACYPIVNIDVDAPGGDDDDDQTPTIVTSTTGTTTSPTSTTTTTTGTTTTLTYGTDSGTAPSSVWVFGSWSRCLDGEGQIDFLATGDYAYALAFVQDTAAGEPQPSENHVLPVGVTELALAVDDVYVSGVSSAMSCTSWDQLGVAVAVFDEAGELLDCGFGGNDMHLVQAGDLIGAEPPDFDLTRCHY